MSSTGGIDVQYFTVLLTPLLVEMDKEWEDLTDDDFIEMDKKAYDDLKNIVAINGYDSFGFRHYKTLEDLENDRGLF
jgi:hypothetical protein